MKLIKDIIYGTQDPKSQVLDLYLPDTETADVLIYFHGGGIESGSKEQSFLSQFTEQGKAVISADYRMYPTAVFPEFIEDAAAVVKWAIDHMEEYIHVKNLFVSGSSAGAYLTAMLAYAEDYLGKHGICNTDITGYIIDSAQMTTHFNVLRERGIDSRRIVVDEAAPVYFVTDKTHFPNALVLVSDNDMPCRPEQNLMFLKTLEMFHCPSEKIVYKLMEGYTHCGYTGNDTFIALLNEYMDSFSK